MQLFKTEKLFFELKTPEYEVSVFGFPVGELRQVEYKNINCDAHPINILPEHLREKGIKICTFRGREDIFVIRLLEELGFIFVSTFNVVECRKTEFKPIKKDTSVLIEIAKPFEYDEVLKIEEKVKDYSTFSIDPAICEKAAAKRNVLRVKSHFGKNNHRVYVVRINERIAGFIQFEVDWENRIAYTLNAGIEPEYQRLKIGKSLFSDSFQALFEEGCEVIFSDYGTQNIGSSRLHLMCNFRIIRQEIHYRFFQNY